MTGDTTSVRNSAEQAPLYTVYEEIANAITHGAGAAAAIVGSVFLLLKAHGDPTLFFPCLAYAVSMVVLFTMSAVYHSISHRGAKRVLRVCDHSSVFFLIAGTYSPYTLIALRGTIGLVVFWAVWLTAITGIILNIIGLERFKKITMACYIASGWCVVLAIIPLLRALPLRGTLLLFLGGFFYTIGLLFYRKKGTRFMHTIWHVFVLAGAVAHYFSILLYVI